jgi:hypothetical protein
MATSTTKTVIGRAEVLNFPEKGLLKVPARIDTGAKTSAIWASSIKKAGNELHVVFLGEGMPGYTGVTHVFTSFDRIVVASSNGQTEKRYKIKLLVELKGRKIRASFTLADRSTQVYPVLVGRNILRGKYVVDVHVGEPLLQAERARAKALQESLTEEE